MKTLQDILNWRNVVWILFICILLGNHESILAQNSLVGDGFGGRLWYRPCNYAAGSYSAYTYCGNSSQLHAWGANLYGQLGYPATPTGSNTPLKVKNMDSVWYCSAGYCMGAIKNDFTAWVWGQPFQEPTMVLNNVRFLDAGAKICSFVRFDGTVWSVGRDWSGSFGVDSIIQYPVYTPVQMKGINNAVRVANGEYNNYILLKNGTVMTVGSNEFSGLGSGHSRAARVYTPIFINSLSNIVDIKASAYNGIALDSGGSVYVWGDGRHGCIGNGLFYDALEPQKVETLKDIVAISACNDGRHFLSLDVHHNCYSWGMNLAGGLGDGTLADNPTPKLVATDVVDIMAGETFSYIVKKDGTLWFAGASIYPDSRVSMNLTDTSRLVFTQIDPIISPMNLCPPVAVYKVMESIQLISLCVGDSLIWNAKVYKTAGTYTDTFKAYYGFDSIHHIVLTYRPKSSRSLYISFCYGDSYQVGKHTYKHSGTYHDTFSNYAGCDSVVHSYITVTPKPIANFDFNKNPVNIFDTLKIRNLSTGANAYKWHFDAYTSTDIHPVYKFLKEGNFKVILVSLDTSSGCSDTMQHEIDVIDDKRVFLPIAFSPNNDNLNDYFRPFGLGRDDVKMSIYNRWGELLYSSVGDPAGWDGNYRGKPCPQDVYVFILEMEGPESRSPNLYYGTLTLLR